MVMKLHTFFALHLEYNRLVSFTNNIIIWSLILQTLWYGRH